MQDTNHYSPLLNADSPLDPPARQLIETLYHREQQKALTLPTDDLLDPKRRQRVGYTWDEMWGQPEAIQLTLDRERQSIQEMARHFSGRPIDRIIMAGCGDSLASMIGVRALLESLLGIPCEPVQALDFTYYYSHAINPRSLVIVLSSSGTTTRVVEALLLAKTRGIPTLALSNTAGSPLMEEADQAVLIHAERKGWPTQSSTAAMAILYQFGLELARLNGRESTEIEGLEKALAGTPRLIADALEEHTDEIAALARREASQPLYLFSGGGPAYASALFGAAKVKECSPDHAIAIQLEEYHHYNSQKAGEPLFLVAPAGPSIPRALDTAREGKRMGGSVYSLISTGDGLFTDHSDAVLQLPAMDERLVPMVYTVPLQLFAYHVAMAKFDLAEKSIDR